MISNINTFSAASYNNYISSGISGGKMYVPVDPQMVLYSQFEHISGVASDSSSGVSVSKINILNTLIDQLIKYKQDTSYQFSKVTDETALTDNQIDSMIKDYENQITTALNIAKSNPFTLTGMQPAAGLVVNTVV